MKMYLSAALALLCAGSAAASAEDGTASLLGTWANSKGSVVVRTEACGEALCGRVIWANAHAQEDARAGGVTTLVGTEVLRSFHRVGRGEWKGIVFVPEKGRTFSSRITMLGPTEIKVQGCIFAGLICQGETWVRR